MNIEKISAADYEKLCEEFNPTKFNAADWVALFKKAGAKYIVITSKHHDGFAMFDAQNGDWDIVDRTKFGRDPLKELADECAKQDMKLFFYHSHLDWHHPEYFPRGMTGQTAGRPESGNFEKYLEYMDAQLAELLSGRYGKIGGIWFDGWWDQQSKRFDGTKDADPKATRLDWHLRRTYDLIHKLRLLTAKTFRCSSATFPAKIRAGIVPMRWSAVYRWRHVIRSIVRGATTPRIRILSRSVTWFTIWYEQRATTPIFCSMSGRSLTARLMRNQQSDWRKWASG
jgi:alpha-L-fucosidase